MCQILNARLYWSHPLCIFLVQWAWTSYTLLRFNFFIYIMGIIIGSLEDLKSLYACMVSSPETGTQKIVNPVPKPYMIYTWPLPQSHIWNKWQILMNAQGPLLSLPLFSYCSFSWEKQWNMDNQPILTVDKSTVTNRQALCMLVVKRATSFINNPFHLKDWQYLHTHLAT